MCDDGTFGTPYCGVGGSVLMPLELEPLSDSLGQLAMSSDVTAKVDAALNNLFS